MQVYTAVKLLFSHITKISVEMRRKQSELVSKHFALKYFGTVTRIENQRFPELPQVEARK